MYLVLRPFYFFIIRDFVIDTHKKLEPESRQEIGKIKWMQYSLLSRRAGKENPDYSFHVTKYLDSGMKNV